MADRCIFVCTILVAIIIKDISAIKCWRCTSRSQFCGDFLDRSNLTESQMNWHFIRCGSVRKKFDYKGDKMIAKCNIRIDLVYDKLVYTRKCVEEAENTNSNSCLTDELFQNDNPNARLISCETCREDGCNNKIINYFISEIEASSNVGLSNVLIIKPLLALYMFVIISFYYSISADL